MHEDFFSSPSLTVALAMAAGILSQAAAQHIKLPGIVILLAVGVLLGPDVGNAIRPDTMTSGLQILVGFAVAIILFEGGLNLRIGHLRHQAKPIRRLITIGAVVTAVGSSVVARVVMGWDWRISILFGTLVIVTGPTVITPLLRRIRVRSNLSTILEAEGIFIDAVGATIAVVALEVALSPSGQSFFLALPDIGLRIGGGAAIGLAGGALLAVMLKYRKVVPHGMHNTLSLAFAVAIFQVSNAVLHESGITAAIVAGFVVGNVRSHALNELVHFKEQLTTLLIGTLFVLLAADVRVADVVALGVPGVITVLLLMVVVRPLTVLASCWGTDVTRNEQIFLSWLAPRGIVAAAVASLFALNLAEHDIAGGVEMRALVFLVIAMTVTLQGLSGGLFAKLLGLKKASNLGVLFLGANTIGLVLAHLLVRRKIEVAFIDANPENCRAAEEAGFPVVMGNGLEDVTLTRAQADARTACVGLTPNESINMLFGRKVQESFRGPSIFVALESADSGVTQDMADELGFRVLFASEVQLAWWSSALEHQRAVTERWQLHFPPEGSAATFAELPGRALLPLVARYNGKGTLVDHQLVLKEKDTVVVGVNLEQREVAYKWLRDHGFVPAPEAEDAADQYRQQPTPDELAAAAPASAEPSSDS